MSGNMLQRREFGHRAELEEQRDRALASGKEAMTVDVGAVTYLLRLADELHTDHLRAIERRSSEERP